MLIKYFTLIPTLINATFTRENCATQKSAVNVECNMIDDTVSSTCLNTEISIAFF